MSSYLYALGRAVYRHRGRALAAWLITLVLVGGLAGLIGKSFDDQFTLPGTQSQEALDSLQRTFPEVGGSAAQLVVVAPEGKSVRNAAVRTAIEQAVKDLDDLPVVDVAQSPFNKAISGTISSDDQAGLVSIQLKGNTPDITDADRASLTTVGGELQRQIPGSQVSLGGEAFSQNIPHLSLIEGMGVVIALVVLLLTLGSLRAAGMPLLTALLGVGISMALVLASTGLATVSSTTPMLALMLGLAVGIDYALFILSRHREQLRVGMEPEESAARAVATAGSAVIFAGLTVMIALSGLAVAGIPFLTTMGVAAAVAVAIAVLIALTLLPALMGFAGEKMRPKERKEKVSTGSTGVGVGSTGVGVGSTGVGGGSTGVGVGSAEAEGKIRLGWAGAWVRAATKWPVLTIVVVIVALGALGLPAKDLRLSLPDNGTAAIGSPQRVTYDLLSKHFGEGFNGPLIVTAQIVGSDDPLGVMKGLANEIRALPGVASVPLSTPNQSADTGIVQVVPALGPESQETKALVAQLRDLAPHFKDKYDVDTAVTGFTAVGIDVSSQLGKSLLPFGILVVGLSLVLLTMVFRSIAVPLKATIGYLLSVVAAFGATALVFEHGWFGSVLNVDQTGPVISFLPIILMGILFGLAMDYEVFLVSRIREDYVHGKSARDAITSGFIGSAKVVVAAAVIMFSVFAFFVPEGEGPIKTIAFGLAVGVFVDAFIVRMTLVPAVLALLGDKAWWLPRWLDRAMPSFDVEGESLHHQLELADWPVAGSGHLLYAEGLGVDAPGSPLFSGVNLDLFPGETLVVEGEPGGARTALLLAITGRLKLDHGQAKVAGLVLPEQANSLRRRTAYLDCAAETNLRSRMQRILKSGPALVVIDNADGIHSHDARAALASVIEESRALQFRRALVLGVNTTGQVADLMPAGVRARQLAPAAISKPQAVTLGGGSHSKGTM